MYKKILLSLTLSVLAMPAFAHVSLEEPHAHIGSTYKAIFRVPHGCDGKATHALRVHIPEGVIAVKPMPKAGWTLEKVKAAYTTSYDYHGSQLNEGVQEIIWSGGVLGDDEYDEFTLRAYFSDAFKDGENVHFPVVQECEGGEKAEWVEIPAQGQDPHDFDYPAPAVTLTVNHDHHHHH